MEINFKDTATLSKKQVNKLLSGEDGLNKIYDLPYSESDILIDEASSIISNYAMCKRLREIMVSMEVTSREYVKRFIRDVDECVSSNLITAKEGIDYKKELLHDTSMCQKYRKLELLKMRSQSYIKTAITYAKTDKDYVNIVEEIVCFSTDIGAGFIADSICDICTRYRSYKTIESILYVLAEYGFIFDDSQIQRIQSSANPHPSVNILNKFYGYQESIIRGQSIDNNREI